MTTTTRLYLTTLTLLSLSTPAALHAATLYGATASGTAGALFTLDPATGALLTTVGNLNDAGGTNYPITGLAVHPTTGVLYGSTGNSPAATAALLVTINPATALVTVVGPFDAGPVNTSGTPATMADIGFDAAGTLFGVGSIGGPHLYSINLTTAKATAIGSSGLASTSGGGIAISPTGTAYGTPTAARYGTYDLTAGTYTNITNPTKPGGGGTFAALDFNPDNGLLYGLNSAPGTPPPTFLATIDPATGAVTTVGPSVIAIDAIAFAPTPSLPGDTNNDGVVDLADLNNVLNNFGATGANPGDDNNDGVVDLEDLNRVLNNFGDTASTSALSTIPEPSSLTRLVAGLLLLPRRRRSATTN